MGKPVSKSFAIVFLVCWIIAIFGTLLAPRPYSVVAAIVGVVALALTIPLLRQVKSQVEEEKTKAPVESSKAWTRVILFLDLLVLAVVALFAYFTWSFYRLSGEVVVPVGYSTLVYAVFFVLIRIMAAKQKKKAIARENGGSRTGSCVDNNHSDDAGN